MATGATAGFSRQQLRARICRQRKSSARGLLLGKGHMSSRAELSLFHRMNSGVAVSILLEQEWQSLSVVKLT